MKKTKNKRKIKQELKGEITVFLALLMSIILVFLGALLTSCRVNIGESYARADSFLAVESVFAEYQTILWEKFHIYAIESTYESGTYSIDNVQGRLDLYDANQDSRVITSLEFLSDNQGASFEAQILSYMKQQYGLDYLDDLLESFTKDSEQWEFLQEEGETWEEEEEASQEILDTQIGEINTELQEQWQEEQVEEEKETVEEEEPDKSEEPDESEDTESEDPEEGVAETEVEESAESEEEESVESEEPEIEENVESEGSVETEEGLEEMEDGPEEVELEHDFLDSLDFLWNVPVLGLVLEDTSVVSQNVVEEEKLASNRTLEVGFGDTPISTNQSGTVSSNVLMEKFLICKYMSEHFYDASDYINTTETETMADSGIDSSGENNSVTDSGTETSLKYELEYLLEGNLSDEDNLNGVVNKLLLLRTGVNYLCLMQSPEKRAEISTLSLSIVSLAGFPGLSVALEQVLLIGWSYAESVMDVKSLLNGEKLTLVKEEEDWKMSFTGMLNLEGNQLENSEAEEEEEEGLSYSEFLEILLYLENRETMVLRALDMLELRMIEAYELSYFQVDHCITGIGYQNTSTVYGGFTYEFPVLFGY